MEEPGMTAIATQTRPACIAFPGEPGYPAGVFNLCVEQRPAAVARPADAGEVAAAVRWAREGGLRVAPQRTGHNAAPLGDLSRTLLLRTDAMTRVELDVPGRRARVEAGARWEDVVPAASEHGLAALHGSTPDVSVTGYSLGGGLGWYARKHGLAANHVLAVELVDADGELRRVDRETDPELFWAVRGGGGSFGVVTAIEFALLPIPEVHAGALFFPVERAREVLHAWHAFTADVPEEVTSVGRILRFPPLPEIPEPLRGNAFALVEAVVLGTRAEADAILAPLRALGPVMDTFATVPPAGIAELHMDPREPMPYAGDHQLVSALPPAAIDALVDVAGAGSGSTMVSFELRHLGGALARRAPGAGALASLAGEFCSFAVGVTPDAAAAAALEADFARVRAVLDPYDAGAYLNFTERAASPGRFFDAATLAGLARVRAAVDPDGRFHANHQVAPR
jgi:FAD/FMN-containing dehydrogenase